MRPHTFLRSSRDQGFTLVEVLVAVAISLFGMLAIFTTVTSWNSHSKSTVSGGDSQSAGALAMFNLERDIRQAGMGFGQAPAAIMGCNVNGQVGGVAFTFPLVPVQITFGATPADPDQITVLYGNSSFYTSLNTFNASDAATTTTQRRNGFNPGDLAVVANGAVAPAECQLVEMTGIPAPDDGVTFLHVAGGYTSFYTGLPTNARYNPPPAPGTPFTTGNLFNLGPAPQRNLWQIDANSALTRTDLVNGVPAQQIAEQVVNLKAQYGIDTNAGALPPQPPNVIWQAAPPANWAQVVAIHVAVLVRSRQYERSLDPNAAVPLPVTPIPPTFASGVPFGMVGTNDGSPTDWRFYRYRVYEKQIQLRNMIWGNCPTCTS